MIDELESYTDVPKCSCCVCTCGAAKKCEEYDNTLKLSQFLMGLNDQYTSIRGQLLMMHSLPTLNQAYSLLLQEETQRDCTNPSLTNYERSAMMIKQ